MRMPNVNRAHVEMGALNESRNALQWMCIESFDFSGVLQWEYRLKKILCFVIDAHVIDSIHRKCRSARKVLGENIQNKKQIEL